ncbi:hypothetical protein BTN49_0466 [Candidatus Enterovibrio escicola]|uniref:Uncharacterized protein n=1 Tax=Candidatus Enterovibrio escicola TaxID=1927127 RepID=A0A2A5T5U0_9GAMM|nr:hypothetical protein BTN49_0466 [Candidatus Enterovibrio escacola]
MGEYRNSHLYAMRMAQYSDMLMINGLAKDKVTTLLKL